MLTSVKCIVKLSVMLDLPEVEELQDLLFWVIWGMIKVEVAENDLNSLFATTLEVVSTITARRIWAGK